MDSWSLAAFLLLVVLGASVQTVTGFAMGLLIMGGVAFIDVAPIAFTAAVVSMLSLFNTGLVLRKSWRFVNVRILRLVCLGLLPGLVIGVLVLGLLSDSSYSLLRRVLGFIIIVAGTLMTLKPAPWLLPSGKLPTILFGSAGGLIGGMFSTGGAPLAFFMYRQPMEFNEIRATLLAIFSVTTLGRTLVVAASGDLTSDMLIVTALAIPLVLLTTIAAGRYVPVRAAPGVRRFAFILLILIGVSLVAGS